MEDKTIVELYWQRSGEAIPATQQKYGAYCTTIAQNILADHRDAEECVSDAYLKIWNSVPPIVPTPLLNYVCHVVKTVSINRYKQNVADKRNNIGDLAIHELDEVLAGHDDIEDELESKRIAGAISDFLDTLDAESRVMFIKRYYFCESVSDIAKYFHKSAHSITVRLSRIREKLKKYLIEKEIIL